MRLDLAEIVRCLGCARDVKVADGSVAVTSVVTDSREAVPGSLFVCIAGERVDGHDYAARAVEQGAVAVLAARPLEGLSVPVLLVQDTVRALGAVAALWRGKSSARVVGITGSAGKTTVKELLAHVLSRRGKTACNALNLNNQVGMPLCMLKTDGDEDFWVFEAGISHEGDMDELGAILQPDLALILNVGAAHTEGLGERGVAWHKSRLLAHLAPEGQALVSADYDDLVREARAVFGDVLFFTASGRPLSYRAAYAGCSDGVHGQYRLWLDGRPCDVIAPFRGDYGTENCIAVAAAAHMLGLTAEEIATHRTDVDLLWMDETMDEWAETIHGTRHNRYPICEDSADNVVGILNAKEYFRLADKSRDSVMRSAVRAPYFVPETIKADALFRNMKRTGNPLAVVLDEYGGMVGIVTLNDLVEELVGDLGDDDSGPVSEDEPRIEKREDGSLLLTGNVELDDIEDALNIQLDQEEHDTLTGLVFDALGVIPDDGEQDIDLETEGMHIHVTSIREHQVDRAEVRLLPKPEPETPDEDDD